MAEETQTTSATARSEKPKLQELFPSMSESICVSVLESKRGNVDEAIETLLTLADDTEETESDRRKKARQAAIERRSRERKSAKKKRRRRTKGSTEAEAEAALSAARGLAAAPAEEKAALPASAADDTPAEVAEMDGPAEVAAAEDVSLHPVATVFKRVVDEKDTEGRAQEAAALDAIMETLEAHEVPAEHVRVVDASADFELMSFLKKTFPNGESLSFPLVKIGTHAIGSAADLRAMDHAALAAVVADAYSAEGDEAVRAQAADPVYVGRGVLDSCLDAAEYVGHGVTSLLWLPVTLLTWPFSRAAPEIPKGPRDVDLAVVHTNWYWRNLRRVFRFADAHIYRIHPAHGDIRAAHLYTAVQSVTRRSPTCVTVHYNDGSAPDELHALPDQCDTIVSLITERALPHVVAVEVVEHPLPAPKPAPAADGEDTEPAEAAVPEGEAAESVVAAE